MSLAYVSMFDTKDEKYKRIEETYPVPNVFFAGTEDSRRQPVPHFHVRGHLVAYTRLIDRDTWLIFRNNLGLLDVGVQNGTAAFQNSFLGSDYFLAPLTIGKPLPR